MELHTQAQNIETIINLYGENFPAEKVHVHFDKELYFPGETIWFKAYVFEENMPTTNSTNFYIALYDENGKILEQKICPIINATTDGHFEIPDSISGKQLICRAYTSWMLNYDKSFLFTKAIKLVINTIKVEKTEQATHLHFFAEGGDIITGERNTIAFKANYDNGLPFEISGIIKKQETGEVVTNIKSVHDGMGKFDIEQLPDEHYYAEWRDNNGRLQKTYLPEKQESGVSLKLFQQKAKLFYNVVNKSAVDTLHVMAYMYQKIIYKANLRLRKGDRYTGIIPLDSFPTGTMQVTVFNTNWQPVAERICFINNNNYLLNVTISTKETSLQKRGRNIIEITLADTLPTNLSLSITDLDFNIDGSNSNIITNLLLNGDIKGYIHNPTYYFTNDSDLTLKEHLDLVMLTHGWRRYNWSNMLTAKLPVMNFAPDNYLAVYGQMSNDALNKVKKGEQVNLIVKAKDSATNYYSIRPDAKGLLKTTGLIFYDTAKIYYSFNTEKFYNKQLTFSTDNFTLQQPKAINDYGAFLLKSTEVTQYDTTKTSYRYYMANKALQSFNKEKLLQEVVIKSGGWRNWKNDPFVKLDEKYTSGMFRGGATSFSFDLLHDEKAWTKLDIYNYLAYKAGGFSIRNGKEGKKFITSSPHGPVEPLIFIDEQLQDNNFLQNLSIEQIAYIKVIPKFYGMKNENEDIIAALSIYLKKDHDLIDHSTEESELGMIKISGYSPIKEFYSPDYTQTSNTTNADLRTTLLWQPYILLDKNNLKVPLIFYNNDFTKKIKVVIEGINEEGKLIHIEKVIEN